MTKSLTALSLLLCALPALAINKCVEPSGRLIFTDRACPPGTQGPSTAAVMPRAASAPPATTPPPPSPPSPATPPEPSPVRGAPPAGNRPSGERPANAPEPTP